MPVPSGQEAKPYVLQIQEAQQIPRTRKVKKTPHNLILKASNKEKILKVALVKSLTTYKYKDDLGAMALQTDPMFAVASTREYMVVIGRLFVYDFPSCKCQKELH